MARPKNVDEVRNRALDIADQLHADFNAKGEIKIISEALKAYNMSLTASKAQLVYGKLCGFGSGTVPFLEPEKTK